MGEKTQKYLVIKAYRSPYPDPIEFQEGEKVQIEKEYTDDPDWKDWVWCTSAAGNQAWTPRQYLQIKGQRGIFLREYNARELSVEEGEEILIHEEINGFGLGVKSSGEKGWVPLRHLTPPDSE